jgi:hypothetical protein
MKRIALLILAGLLAASVYPQAAKSPEKPPVIPVELLKDFYAADAAQQRAQREMEAAQRDVQSAAQVWRQAVDALQKVCGDKFQLHQDSVNADPDCVPKPAEPAKK